MATEIETTPVRTPLTRERVLRTAIAMADEGGIDALSMRKVGQELGVEAMSLYNHVKNKDDMLDGMVDLVVNDIELISGGAEWKSAMRDQILRARSVMARHQWAPGVIETRTTMSPPIMRYFDSIAGIMRDGGFSVNLLHHAMHALGSRVLGFTQELYDDSAAMEASPEIQAVMLQQMTAEYPNISAVVAEITHEDPIIGSGCDSDFEFVFSIDLTLEGLERIKDAA